MDSKERAVRERIQRLEDAIARGKEYLESGKHAEWQGFRPLFIAKISNGKRLPPHKDWVRSIFLPRREKALGKYYGRLEKLIRKEEDKKSR